MRVTFHAFGDLRRHTPGMQERLDLDVAERSTVLDVLVEVGVPWEEVGLVVVNGKLEDEKRELVQGDKLEVFSPIGGG
ncbi:MAG: MoaD/ThiS family protein [Chloroflexota bacterium]